MSTPDQPRELSSSEQEQVQQWLEEAEAASKAGDWGRAVAQYRKALEFDRALQGVEAKLQYAIRMRDTENLYQQGKSLLEQGKYAEALVPLRKARLMYASHYKDVDELIVRAQSALQKEKWETRPAAQRVEARKQQRQQQQRVVLALIAVVLVLAVAAVLVWTSGFGFFAAPSSSATPSSTGAAGAIPPQQRNNMYKSAPAITIDPTKSYRATIETSKGTIVADLFPQDAPQTVNNFVFLARDGFYNGLTFHRVVKDPTPFVIQGGDPLGNGTGGPGYNIPPEIKRTHTKGALAMARTSGPPQTTPSSGSQFYITLDATPFLDGQYTVFGQATSDSMSVVNQIQVGDVIKTITIQEQ